jgi:VIT1/CCC1 family predicted Fe2+/Mn2+ transporter
VLKYEWPALGEGRTDKQANELFVEILAGVVEAKPATEAQKLIHARLLEMAQQTASYRGERVAKSLTRMPPTLSGLVQSIAAVLLLLVFAYPFQDEITGALCLVLVSVVLFLANFVMTDTDNPIRGVWNVSPKPFAVLASQ